MNVFSYKNRDLYVENVAISAIASDIGTPSYIYSTLAMQEAYKCFTGAFSKQRAQVCFAMKSNSNLAVINTFAELGAGADVVSNGELMKAISAGIKPKNIVYSGVGKTRQEMSAGIEAGILQFNVESLPELLLLSDIAASKNTSVDIAIRVNPDVDADTHHKISTGRKEDKFGIDIFQAKDIFNQALSLPGLSPVSIAVHIGSQLTDLSPFETAFKNVATLTRDLRSNGFEIKRLDLGGGLGISYGNNKAPNPDDYAKIVESTIGSLDCDLIFEPGRYLTGNAGILLTSVIYYKDTGYKRFVVVDAAMNDLLRPALYEAEHAIQEVRKPADTKEVTKVDVVGPICETGDTFAIEYPLTSPVSGDLLVIKDTGAYGAVMASSYNSRPLVPEVLVSGEDYALVRRRETLEEQINREFLAPWQNNIK